MEKRETTKSKTTTEPESDQFLQKHNLFLSQRAFSEICSMLSISSLLSLQQTSKDAARMVNTYMKGFLIKNNLVDEINRTDPKDYYYKIWRSTFARELQVASLQGGNIPRPINHSEFQTYTRFCSAGVKNFSLGTKFAVFHLLNDSIVFMKTEEYLNPIQDIDTLWRNNTRTKVKSFYAGSNNLIYQTQEGKISFVFDEADKASNQLQESALEFTVSKPVHFWAASYTFAVFGYNDQVAEESKSEKEEEKADVGKPNKYVTKRVVNAFILKDLTAQDLNNPERFIQVNGLDAVEISDLCVGSTQAYFADDKGVVYECDFSAKDIKKADAIPFEPLKKKHIRQLFSGWTYFYAIEQDLVKGIGYWTNEEVIAWASKNGFQDYCKILKYENVDGKVLAEADRDYILHTLGITREDLQSKFLYEISSVIEDSKSNQKLYGWGNNNAGQLALPKSNLAVKHPQLIPLPEFLEKEEISHLECGFKCAVLATNFGRLFITDPIEKTRSKSIEKKKQGDEPQEKPEKANKKAKGEKHKEREVEESVKEKKPKAHSWEDISVLSINPKNKKINKIECISLNKDYIAVLGSLNEYVKKGEDPYKVLLKYEQPIQKIRDGEYVINRILWDTSYNKADFTVGYEDRFLGMMEMPFEEFITSEVPKHRIRNFKMKGRVMWDRTKRINNF